MKNVSEGLSSVETIITTYILIPRTKFQKDLVVWKLKVSISLMFSHS